MAPRARLGFSAIARRLRRDNHGAVLVLMAVTMTALLAILGVAVDVGWWYTLHQQNQSAADSAALSAAYEVLAGKTDVTNNLTPAASQAATLNGYAGTTPAVTYPYTDATVTSGGVQVVLRQAQSAWFASLASLTGVSLANRAVAALTVLDSPCIYAVNPTAQKALNIQGSPTLTSPTCAICVASNASNAIYVQGGSSAVITADSMITAGQLSTTGSPNITLNHPAQFGAPQSQCADPFAGTLTHSFLTTGMPTTPACT
jgi:Flp pilus assembly protein TadG